MCQSQLFGYKHWKLTFLYIKQVIFEEHERIRKKNSSKEGVSAKTS